MEKLLQSAILSAILAGDEILSVYVNNDLGIEYKQDDSPLTLADKKSHVAIVNGLKETGIPVLSEEGKTIPYSDRSKWELFWLIDPLDGTKEFIKRNGEFTVNIALVELGKPVMGVVYVPVTRVLYYASAKTGSYKITIDEGFTPADISSIIPKAELLANAQYPDVFTIVASRSHSTKETEDFISQKEEEFGQINLISAGSSLKLCLVAEHKAHVYPRLAPTMEWDTAAGHAVALYANCTVNDYNTGNELIYNKENMLNPWFIVAGEY